MSARVERLLEELKGRGVDVWLIEERLDDYRYFTSLFRSDVRECDLFRMLLDSGYAAIAVKDVLGILRRLYEEGKIRPDERTSIEAALVDGYLDSLRAGVERYKEFCMAEK